MGLLDLPPELLDAIINYAGPAGIESFVLSCKAVHVRAASQIQQHNALKRRWTSTTLSRPTALHGDALHLLYDISQDPLTAQYVEVLSLWDRRLEESIDPDNVEDFRTNEQGMAEIKKTVMENRYLQLANVDLEDWWDHIVSEGPDDIFYIVITLLSLLPNLKTLQLPPGRWGNFNPYEFSEEPERTLVSVLDTIVSQAHPTGYSGPPLSKLEKILPFTPEGYDMRAGLQSLEPFMVLDSIREIYASSCVAVDDSYTGIPFQWRHGHQPSPITKLELAHCCIDAEGLEALVAHTPALHTFRYSHQTKWHGCQHDWNPGAFLSTLGKYCGPNINHLAVTIDELLGDIINGMSTFFAFPALQTLEVDVRVFCGPPLESGQQLGEGSRSSEGANPWTHSDIPCIGEMLPPSIEEVEINTDFPQPDEAALNSLLKNIVFHRGTRLFRLHKFIVRQFDSDSAQTLADKVGVTLEVFSTQRAGHPDIPRAMMPRWKRTFEEDVGPLPEEQ
ncbi:hypothetical protein BS50DRAFT_531582 [Corynespora cassiicola Philippines]|uniref:F-box domain-containing protein n=1 Tax=Corynespora cassiicola Philippines TaxID=1448308 RepID=A0A2T2NBJ1_CORCC|nr:hypothetical protein BS50DRAFT_531582 [Corynespora cassiicola Philippines]